MQQYFLKGDISGIQEFIFNVKSEGAAKSLKGRSFFIQVLSLIGIEMVKDAVGADNVEVFYNGGGNFYLIVKGITATQIQSLQATIDETCHERNFHLTLSMIETSEEELNQDFGAVWAKVNNA